MKENEKFTLGRVIINFEGLDNLKDLGAITDTFSDDVLEARDTVPPLFNDFDNQARKKRIVMEAGKKIWGKYGPKNLQIPKQQIPLAGIYLSTLAFAQKLSPEERKSIIEKYPLESPDSQKFRSVLSAYDYLVYDSNKPGCLGQLTGQKGIGLDEVYQLEKSILQSYQRQQTGG